jgi:hypothetical protein
MKRREFIAAIASLTPSSQSPVRRARQTISSATFRTRSELLVVELLAAKEWGD